MVGGALAAVTLGIVFRKRIANLIKTAEKESGTAKTKPGTKPEPVAPGELTEKIVKNADGTVLQVNKYNAEGKKVETFWYGEDGKTLYRLSKYNAEGKMVEAVKYREDGKTIQRLDKCNAEGKMVETVWYKEDGVTIDYIQKR